jgi:glycosyltransferase involved in cell wall biosynthesis
MARQPGAKPGTLLTRRVLIVAPAPPPPGGMALQAKLLARLLREDGVSVSFLASNFDLPRMARVCRHVPGVRTFLRFLLIWSKVWQEISGVGVVHVFAASWLYFFAAVCPSILIGRLCRKRTVLNYRGGDAARFFRRWRWVVRPVFRAATLVTAPSQFLAQLIRRSFDIPVAIVPNILDTSAFQFLERKEFYPRLLVNRNLERMYDIESILRAFRQIRDCHPSASLWIVGSGSDEQRLRSLAAEWNLTTAVFLGHIDHVDLPAIYKQRDILLNASTVDNFPASLLEASAAGLVVVSTAAGGIPFIYENEKTALLVELGAWRALAVAVDRVIRDSSMALRLTKEARTLTHQCSWELVRMSLYACYGRGFEDQVLQRPAGSGWTCGEFGERSV